MRRYSTFIFAVLLLAGGCKDGDRAPLPAPAITLGVTAKEDGMHVAVTVPQDLKPEDQNFASYIFFTTLNSSLTFSRNAHEEAMAHVESVRVSWQSFWVGLFALMGVISVCVTTLLKGLMVKK